MDLASLAPSLSQVDNATSEQPMFSGGDTVATAFETIISACFLLGFALNVVLLLVFVKRRGFREQISNRFVMSLVLSNLCFCLLLMPLILTDSLLEVPPIAALGRTFDVLFAAATAASLFSQTLIGTDQYLAILHPLHYHRLASNSSKNYLACLGTWVASALVGCGRALDVWLGGNDGEYNSGLSSTMTPTFGNLFFVVVYLIPVVFLSFVYTRIFCAARSNSMRTRRNSNSSSVLEGQSPQQQLQHATIQLSLSAISHFTSAVRHKLSHAGARLVHREETRAAKLALFVLLTLVTCWTPYFVLVLGSSNALLLPDDMAPWVNPMVLSLVCLSTVITPFLYAYRSRRICRDVRRALGLTDSGDFSRVRNFLLGHQSDDFWLNQGRKAGSSRLMQRAKSISCPHLLIPMVEDEKRKLMTEEVPMLQQLPTDEDDCRSSCTSGSTVEVAASA